ncbi:hypothetical protein M440DRAFT_1339175 [Trichoderma longibrachiatum ATCC 18648]|uniref:Uncharacterized protein n=1 Tax=Trichoderma longibrachiatum ATCC 18648 TaxID=983965 RepID=A0A2T4BXA1_TRILO|nr:hypothetical protein M440DRAFT_1339175 [Trichoderma longibrachiatum ATCC 18648]
MLEHFTPRHIMPLLVASATTFGGLWPFWSPKNAMLEFGLPESIAASRAAHPVMVLCSARTTALGMLMFAFYRQKELAAVDTVMSVMGAYLGLVDGYVCWKEGMTGKAVFRCVSGMAIAAWGLAGLTEGGF